MSIQCLNINGIGKTCKVKTPITTVRGLFLTIPGFAFASATDFADKDKWLEYIAAGSIIPLQGVREEEVQDFEDPIIETTSGEKIGTFEGQRGTRYKLLFPLDQHKLVRDLDNGTFGVILADRNNNLRATILSDDTITGFATTFFKVWKMETPSAENAPYTVIDVQYEDPNEWDKDGVYVEPSWLASRLEGVLSVNLACGVIGAGVFVATVKYIDSSSYNADGSALERVISGLTVLNFEVFDQLGALLTPTTDYTAVAVAGTPGDYTIDTTPGTPITGGTCQVVADAAAPAMYKSDVVTLA